MFTSIRPVGPVVPENSVREDSRDETESGASFCAMLAFFLLLGTFVANLFRSRRWLEVENLFLRHQLNIALRGAPHRLRLCGSDRALLGSEFCAVSCSITPCSNAPELSNNIIQKRLAFDRDWSGTVLTRARKAHRDPAPLASCRRGASVVRRDAASIERRISCQRLRRNHHLPRKFLLLP